MVRARDNERRHSVDSLSETRSTNNTAAFFYSFTEAAEKAIDEIVPRARLVVQSAGKSGR
jgi:hypothetical protein